MNIAALGWAFQVKLVHPCAKAILVAMAFDADATLEACLSVDTLSDMTGFSRKPILAALHELVTQGYLSDTGRKAGKTGRVTVYHISMETNGVRNDPITDLIGSKVTLLNRVKSDPITPPNGVTSDPIASPVSDPPYIYEKSIHTDTVKGAVTVTSADFDPLAYLLSQGIELQVAKDWLYLLKEKKQAATRTKLGGVLRDLHECGFSANDGLRLCCERNWASFNQEWFGKKAVPDDTPIWERRS